MTSQSPRIYLYKITFEEVPYYYYGIHKEKVFGEEYCGSPKTNRWCWKLYTPKKQILQLFDFTDEGWLEAKIVETRVIKPFLNMDKWCLNENCGGIVSLEVLRESGNKCYELGLGIHSLTKEQRSEIGKIGGKIGGEKGGRRVYELGVGAHGRTREQMSEDGKRGGKITYENKIGIHGRTKEEMIENGRKCGNRTYELGIGIHGQSKEQMTENGRKGGKIGGKLGSKEDKSKAAKKANSQRWICLETGYVSNAGGLSNYQRVRGIDTSKRKRIG
jgi:hypothetical protein